MNSLTDDKPDTTAKVTHEDVTKSPIRTSSPDSLIKTEKQQDGNTHQRFVLTDPVAFRYYHMAQSTLLPLLIINS